MQGVVPAMIAHYTGKACSLQNGDLLASGKASGSNAASRACHLDITWQGIENGKSELCK